MAEAIKIEVIAEDLASSVLSGIGGAGVAMGAAIIGALVGATAAMVDFVNTAAEAEEIQTMFNAIVGNSPLADYTDEMYGLADALSAVTQYDDEAILGAEGVLAKYGTIGKDIFPQATKATLDLAASMKTTAEGAAGTLGRALKDLASGSANMLVRSGALKDAQAELITEMAKGGDVVGAQALLFKNLEGNIGGLAEKMGGTFNGQTKIFWNTIDNLKESLGGKLLPILTPLIGKFTELALQIMPMLGDVMDKYVVPIVNLLVSNIGYFIDLLLSGMNPLQAFITLLSSITGLNLQSLLAPIMSFVNGIIKFFQDLGAGLWTFLVGVWNGIVEFVKGILVKIKPGLDSFKKFWDENSKGIQDTVKGAFTQVGRILGDLAGKVIPWLVEKFNQLGAWFVANGPLIQKTIKVIADQWVGTTQAVTSFWMVVQPILDLFITQVGNAVKIVMQLFTGNGAGAFETWKKAWGDTFAGIGAIITGFGDWVGQYFGTTWAQTTAQWGAFFTGIGAMVRTFLNNFRILFTLIPTVITNVLTQAGTVIANWFIATTASWALGWFNFQSKVAEIWDNILAAITDTITYILTSISNFITNAINQITGAASSFISAGKSIMTNISAGISSAVSSTLSQFVSFGSSVVSSIQQGISNAWDGFVSWITEKIQSIISGLLAGVGASGTGADEIMPSQTNTIVAGAQTSTNGTGQTVRSTGGAQTIKNNFFGPITLKLESDSDFLKAR